MGGCPIARNLKLLIDFRPYERYTYRALPGIPIAIVPKCACVILIGAPMGTLREPFQPGPDDHEQDCIHCSQDGLEMKRANQFTSETAGSVISANRISVGSCNVVFDIR